MSQFKLSDLGEKFKTEILKLSKDVIDIHWELVDYNLKTNAIAGDLVVLVEYVDDEDNFNKLKTTLLLSDMDVNVGGISAGYKKGILLPITKDNPSIARYIIRTFISLDDFPEIALGNYIKDAQETLTYEWQKEDKE
tara:strand:- start:739 stop:1149 length:411 start_codon:yes stop_codon:yes gene_type:complete